MYQAILLVASELKLKKILVKIFFWILGGIPKPQSKLGFEYFIIPSTDMAKNIKEAHELWLGTPARNGQPHNQTNIRTVHLPPYKSLSGWEISKYRERWDQIEAKLKT
ncbi:MAG: hypothetical protein CTY19_13135 [Methylomonas sp.]|nr:MAG: hypothetical protein CTY19_13135 [Methylomonas sp.]